MRFLTTGEIWPIIQNSIKNAFKIPMQLINIDCI